MLLAPQRWFREKFAFKVFVIFSGFVAVISISFTAFFYGSQKRMLEDGLLGQGKVLAGVLAQGARLGVFSEDKTQLRESVAGVFAQKGVAAVAVFSREGAPLLVLRRMEDQNVREVAGAAANPQVAKTIELLRLTPSTLRVETGKGWEFWCPVLAGGGYATTDALFLDQDRSLNARVIGFIEVAFDRAVLEGPLADRLLESFLIGGCFLLFGAGVTLLSVNRVTRPLRRLTEAVDQLGKGEAPQPVGVTTRDEVGSLAEAFQRMSLSLKTQGAEKEQLEAQLRQSQKMEAVGTLAGGIAHDFNNVLAVIVGCCDLALMDAPPGSPLYDNIEETLRAAERGSALIRQILIFSRKQQEESSPVQLECLFGDALRMLRATLPANIRTEFQPEEDLPDVMADATQMQQVLMNLCTNAGHAMPEGGILRVKLDKLRLDARDAGKDPDLHEGDYIRLTVSDTGTGIAPEAQERIFDPYFTTKEKGKGTGLGLALVHGIVKRHGGAIRVRSKMGWGTTFEVYLPAVPRQEVALSGEPEISLQGGNERILLVDDEAVILHSGEQILSRLGYVVTPFSDPVEALEGFEKDPARFDLIIADVTMPNLSGEIMAAAMLKVRPGIPVILSTGYSDRITPEKVAVMGFSRLVMKPLGSDALARLVREVLDEAAAR